MDFAYHYTDEQETFRQEVKAWLADHVPSHIKAPVDSEFMRGDLYDFALELRRKLGHKGWLAPTLPTAYGGGGLSVELAVIIEEELRRRKIPTVFSNPLVIPAILVWGTEEQKKKFLPGILHGEKICYQNFTEPQAGSDLANVQSRAVNLGDEWVINGQKIFVSGGGPGKADWLFGPIMTDPDAPRHRNLGYFMIPATTQGITLTPLDLMNGRNQYIVMMEDAHVPADHLIGGDHQGWQVAQTVLEQEHGGGGQPHLIDQDLDNFIDFVGNASRDGRPMSEDPLVQQQVAECYIDSHASGLFSMRNHWLYHSKSELTYEGSQSSLQRKLYGLRNADRMRAVMGPYCLLGIDEQRAPFGGAPEVFQRSSLVRTHPGGTIEVQKVIIARRLGISKTRESAAPTPQTAGRKNGSP
ncbi:MAG: acyl-CoA dehydrogenase family protein [Chloroflexi bacterium]|nr:acyl-CoA dehydrogenase family protein [Chloroflexota bacterium]